jgi:hypothetical protein
VFTPFLVGRTRAGRDAWDSLVSTAERAAFLDRFGREAVPETRYLSRRLSLAPDRPYAPSTEAAREAELARSRARFRAGDELVAGQRP